MSERRREKRHHKTIIDGTYIHNLCVMTTFMPSYSFLTILATRHKIKSENKNKSAKKSKKETGSVVFTASCPFLCDFLSVWSPSMCVYVLSLCVYVCGVHSVPHSTLRRTTVKHRGFKYVKIESWNDVFAEILSSVSFSFGTADVFHLWNFFPMKRHCLAVCYALTKKICASYSSFL